MRRKRTTGEYTKQHSRGGCCLEGTTSLHRTCTAGSLDETQCQAECDKDSSCKGFYTSSKFGCDLVTTSSCSSDAFESYKSNVGNIDPSIQCSTTDYLGCYSKIGSSSGGAPSSSTPSSSTGGASGKSIFLISFMYEY